MVRLLGKLVAEFLVMQRDRQLKQCICYYSNIRSCRYSKSKTLKLFSSSSAPGEAGDYSLRIQYQGTYGMPPSESHRRSKAEKAGFQYQQA
jgi:hypothetical protein